MSFFGKIKQNIHNGGVNISLQAADSFSRQDPSLPVSVTIAATNEGAQVNSVKAEILATSMSKSFSQPMGQTNSSLNNTPSVEVVARADNAQPFSLQPGESQTLQLNIIINSGQGQPPPGGGFMYFLNNASEVFNPNSYSYSLKVSADVAGIALDPSASQKLHLRGVEGIANSTGFDIKL